MPSTAIGPTGLQLLRFLKPWCKAVELAASIIARKAREGTLFQPLFLTDVFGFFCLITARYNISVEIRKTPAAERRGAARGGTNSRSRASALGDRYLRTIPGRQPATHQSGGPRA